MSHVGNLYLSLNPNLASYLQSQQLATFPSCEPEPPSSCPMQVRRDWAAGSFVSASPKWWGVALELGSWNLHLQHRPGSQGWGDREKHLPAAQPQCNSLHHPGTDKTPCHCQRSSSSTGQIQSMGHMLPAPVLDHPSHYICREVTESPSQETGLACQR